MRARPRSRRRVRAPHGTHSSSSIPRDFPRARGRHVPTISPRASTAPGRPIACHSALWWAPSGTRTSRSPLCRNRSYGPSSRTASVCGASCNASRSASRSCDPTPSTSTGTASDGHRAATSGTGESKYAATCRVVSGPDRCRRVRTEPSRSSSSSGRSSTPTWSAGQRGMRRTTGGEVAGSSSSPACRAASRNGISYTCVAWQPSHQRRYASGIRAVMRVDSSPLTNGSVTTSRMARAVAARASVAVMPAAFSGRDAVISRFDASASECGRIARSTPLRSARR